MSRKKTHKSDYSLFANKIGKLADDNGGKYAFADALGVVYDSVRRWCNGENIPDGQQLLTIHEKFGTSIDWLLTGKEGKAPLPDEWPPDVIKACLIVHRMTYRCDCGNLFMMGMEYKMRSYIFW